MHIGTALGRAIAQERAKDTSLSMLEGAGEGGNTLRHALSHSELHAIISLSLTGHTLGQ